MDININRFESEKDLVLVAKVSKSYGSSGSVVVRLLSDKFAEFLDDYLERQESTNSSAENENVSKITPIILFIYFDTLITPFIVDTITPKGGNAWVVTFRYTDDSTHAETLVGKEIFASKELLSIDNEEEVADDFIGYRLYNQDDVFIGNITDLVEFSSNLCLQIDDPSLSLVPIHQDLIIDIDDQNKTIKLQIANGLI